VTTKRSVIVVANTTKMSMMEKEEDVADINTSVAASVGLLMLVDRFLFVVCLFFVTKSFWVCVLNVQAKTVEAAHFEADMKVFPSEIALLWVFHTLLFYRIGGCDTFSWEVA